VGNSDATSDNWEGVRNNCAGCNCRWDCADVDRADNCEVARDDWEDSPDAFEAFDEREEFDRRSSRFLCFSDSEGRVRDDRAGCGFVCRRVCECRSGGCESRPDSCEVGRDTWEEFDTFEAFDEREDSARRGPVLLRDWDADSDVTLTMGVAPSVNRKPSDASWLCDCDMANLLVAWLRKNIKKM